MFGLRGVHERFTLVFSSNEAFQVERVVFCGAGRRGFIQGVVFLVGEGVACRTHHLRVSFAEKN